MADFGLLLLVLSGIFLLFLLTFKLGEIIFNQLFPKRIKRSRRN